MSLILHIVRKDFRHTRALLVTWFSIAFLPFALLATVEQALVVPVISQLFLALEIPVRAAVISRLVHSDATVGTSAFWLSRPISGGTLLSSKTILIALLVILPLIALNLIFGDPSPTATEFFLSPPYISTLFFMMLAVVTPNLARMAGLGAIIGGGTLGGIVLTAQLARHLDGRIAIDETVAGGVTIVGICVAVICHQYLTRRTKRSLVIAFSGIPVLLLLLTARWP